MSYISPVDWRLFDEIFIVLYRRPEFAEKTWLDDNFSARPNIQHVKQMYVNSLNCHLILSSAALFAFHWDYLAREFGLLFVYDFVEQIPATELAAAKGIMYECPKSILFVWF